MELNKITEKIIGCCIEVHKQLGPGLLESVYESALCIEFQRNDILFERQKSLPVIYKGEKIGDFRIDLLVAKTIVIELKSVERMDPVFEAQILSYMKLGTYKLGLLINFNSKLLKNGIKRFII
ncbi:MAG TPA: GxxExxY protein [Candidatus Marinimicrobia bacterium]|nr:GxxExxY protein [Candidatus Neomarinimicrobiota bacterium]